MKNRKKMGTESYLWFLGKALAINNNVLANV